MEQARGWTLQTTELGGYTFAREIITISPRATLAVLFSSASPMDAARLAAADKMGDAITEAADFLGHGTPIHPGSSPALALLEAHQAAQRQERNNPLPSYMPGLSPISVANDLLQEILRLRRYIRNNIGVDASPPSPPDSIWKLVNDAEEAQRAK